MSFLPGYFPSAALGDDDIGVPLALALSTDASLQYLWRQLPASGTFNRKTYTVSAWIKYLNGQKSRGIVSGAETNVPLSGERTFNYVSGTVNGNIASSNIIGALTTTAFYRTGDIGTDDGGWHHIVWGIDSTNADKVKFWLDGALQTDASVAASLSTNEESFLFGASVFQFIGKTAANDTSYLIAFVDVVEGTRYDADDFAFDDGGTWTRSPFAGSYGTHGFGWDGTAGEVTLAGETLNAVGAVFSATDLPPYTF